MRTNTYDENVINELNRLKAYARSNGDHAALLLAADDIAKLRYEVEEKKYVSPNYFNILTDNNGFVGSSKDQ